MSTILTVPMDEVANLLRLTTDKTSVQFIPNENSDDYRLTIKDRQGNLLEFNCVTIKDNKININESV